VERRHGENVHVEMRYLGWSSWWLRFGCLGGCGASENEEDGKCDGSAWCGFGAVLSVFGGCFDCGNGFKVVAVSLWWSGRSRKVPLQLGDLGY